MIQSFKYQRKFVINYKSTFTTKQQRTLSSGKFSFAALSQSFTTNWTFICNWTFSITHVSASNFSTLSLPTSTNKSNSSCKAVRSSTNNHCKVFKQFSNGWHYGVSACEACKQFFLRSTKEKRVYTCINDSKKCLVNDKGRFGCRKCRFKSCLTNGMNIYLVREDRTRGGRTNWKPYHYSPSQITEILKGKL